jgi:dCTP diphosphatase
MATVQVGELSGIFQWRGELPPGLVSSLPPDEQQHLARALSDVLLYLLRLADVCGVDLGRAALQKLADNAAK